MARRFGIIIFVLFVLNARVVRAQDSTADLFVEAAVDQAAPFVGQQILYTVRVYEALDRVDTSPLYEAPDFEGFWRVDVQPMPFSQTSQQINNRTYIVSEIRVALYATRPGELRIDPATIVLPETVFRPEQRVRSNSVTVQALPLPDGAPDGFSGAVGQLELAATLNRQTVTLGEPITLRLTVRGTGNVEPLPAPNVRAPAGWQVFANPGTFVVAQDNAGRIIGEKLFEWVFIPNTAGAAQLPTITLPYFDPAGLVYRTLETTPITIVVQSSGGIPAQTMEPVRPAEFDRLPLKPVPAAVTVILSYPPWWFWLLWLIAPAGTAASAGWVLRQQRRQRERGRLRRAAALDRAKARLRTSVTAPDAFRQIGEAIWEYFGDKLDCAPRRLSQEWLRQMMVERQIPAELGKRIMLCLERSNEGLYAPMSAVDIRQLATFTRDTLELVEAAWERQ